jgi:hypothetical protein
VTHLFKILLLALMTLRFAVPAGFMLAPADGDGLTVVVCTSSGLKLLSVDSEGNPKPADNGGPADQALCAFSTAAALVADTGHTAVAAPIDYISIAFVRPDIALRDAARSRPYLARAPPVGLA